MHKRDRVYYLGVITTFISLAWLSISLQFDNMVIVPLALFVVGVSLVLAGYMK